MITLHAIDWLKTIMIVKYAITTSLLHTLVCNKTFKVQSGDWIHAI